MKSVTNICIACGYKPITGMACPKCAEKDKVTYHATARQQAEKVASVPIKINKDLDGEFWRDVQIMFGDLRALEQKEKQINETLGIYDCVGCGQPAYPNKIGLPDQCENCFGKKEKSAPTETVKCPNCLNTETSLDFDAGGRKVCESCYRKYVREQIRLYGFNCVTCQKKVSSVMILDGKTPQNNPLSS